MFEVLALRACSMPILTLASQGRLRYLQADFLNLQRNAAALDELEGILRAEPVVIKGGVQVPLSVSVPELVSAGEALEITGKLADP